MKNVDIKSIDPRRIAVIDLAMIGDLICALPAICSLKKTYPGSNLTAVVSTSSAPVMKYSSCVDEIFTIEKKQIFHSFSLLRETIKGLSERNFDIIYLFHNSIGSAILARSASIPVRVGYATELRAPLLTHPIHPPGEKLHLTEQKLNQLRRVGLTAESCPPSIAVERELAQATLSRLLPDLDKSRPLVLIAVGSTWLTKIWPMSRISALVNKLPVGSCSVALIGSPEEVILTENITCLPVPMFNLVGKTTLDELIHLISMCDALITPDNGPMHIAAALDKPVIAIFGPTDPKICGMLHTKAIHLRADTPCLGCWEKKCNYKRFCMDLVTEDEVLSELMKILV
jgi:heptosyltransferase I